MLIKTSCSCEATYLKNLFEPSDAPVNHTTTGVTLSDHLVDFSKQCPEVLKHPVVVYVSGNLVYTEHWATYQMQDFDTIRIVPVVGMSALTAVILFVYTYSELIICGLLLITAAAATYTAVQMYRMQEQMKKMSRSTGDFNRDAQTANYSWNGAATQASEATPIPIVYGYNMVGGNVISEAVTINSSTGDSQLTMLLALSEGPIAYVNEAGIMINETYRKDLRTTSELSTVSKLGIYGNGADASWGTANSSNLNDNHAYPENQRWVNFVDFIAIINSWNAWIPQFQHHHKHVGKYAIYGAYQHARDDIRNTPGYKNYLSPSDPYWKNYYAESVDVDRMVLTFKHQGYSLLYGYRYALVDEEDHSKFYTGFFYDATLWIYLRQGGVDFSSTPYGVYPTGNFAEFHPEDPATYFHGVTALPNRTSQGIFAKEVVKSSLRPYVTQDQYNRGVILMQVRRMDAYDGSLIVEACTQYSASGVAYDDVALLHLFFSQASEDLNGGAPNIRVPVAGISTIRQYSDPTHYTVGFTNNPIWCALDLMTSKRYGLGRSVTWDMIDIEAAIYAAHLCDSFVESPLVGGTTYDLDPDQVTGKGGIVKFGDEFNSDCFTVNPGATTADDRVVIDLRSSILPTNFYIKAPMTYAVINENGVSKSLAYNALFALEYSDDGVAWHLVSSGNNLSMRLANAAQSAALTRVTEASQMPVIPVPPAVGSHRFWSLRLESSRASIVSSKGALCPIIAFGAFGDISVTAAVEKYAEFNGVLDTSMDIYSALDAIFGVCGATLTTNAYGQLKVLMDVSTPMTQIFTRASVTADGITYTFGSKQSTVNSLEVHYQDSTDNYKETAMLVATGEAPVKSSSVNLRGVTKRAQALRVARYKLNKQALCNASVSFKVPAELCTVSVGEVFGLQDRVIGEAYGGRIMAVQAVSDGTIFSLMEDVTFVDGVNYELTLTYLSGEQRKLSTVKCVPAYRNEPHTTRHIKGLTNEFSTYTYSIDNPIEFILCEANNLSKYRVSSLGFDFEDGTVAIEAAKYDERMYSVAGTVKQNDLRTLLAKPVSSPSDAVNPVTGVVTISNMGGNGILLSFNAPDDDSNYLDTRVSVSKLGVTDWTVAATVKTASNLEITGLAVGESYVVRLEPRTLSGVLDTKSVVLTTIKLTAAGKYPPAVSRLQVANRGGNDREFVGNDCEITWLHTASSTGEAETASYVIKVYAGTRLLRQAKSTAAGYIYTYQMNLDDNQGGGPIRDLTFEVWAVSPYGVYSTAATKITVNNALPKKIYQLSGSGSFGAAQLTWLASVEKDVLGYNVYVGSAAGVKESDFSGFTKDASYLFKKIGTAALADKQDVYVKVVAVDGFGPGTLTDADEITFKVQAIDLPVYTMDVPFTSGINWSVENKTAFWTQGKIVYRGTEYPIPAGNTVHPYIFWDSSKPDTMQASKDKPTLTLTTWMMMYFDGTTAQAAEARKIIHGGLIQADTITAEQLMVDTLAAITTKTGDLTIEGGGAIHGGQNYYNTGGKGFWLGFDGNVPKFSLGSPAGNKLLYDGENLVIEGTIYATDENLNYNPPVSKWTRFLAHFDYDLSDRTGLLPDDMYGGVFDEFNGWKDGGGLKCGRRFGVNLLPNPTAGFTIWRFTDCARYVKPLYSERPWVYENSSVTEEPPIYRTKNPNSLYWDIAYIRQDYSTLALWERPFVGVGPWDDPFFNVNYSAVEQRLIKIDNFSLCNGLYMIKSMYAVMSGAFNPQRAVAQQPDYMTVFSTKNSLVALDKAKDYAATVTLFLYNRGFPIGTSFYTPGYLVESDGGYPATGGPAPNIIFNSGIDKTWYGNFTNSGNISANGYTTGKIRIDLFVQYYDTNKNPITDWHIVKTLSEPQFIQQFFTIGSIETVAKRPANAAYMGIGLKALENASPCLGVGIQEMSIREVLNPDLEYTWLPTSAGSAPGYPAEWHATAPSAGMIPPSVIGSVPYSNTNVFPEGGPTGTLCAIIDSGSDTTQQLFSDALHDLACIGYAVAPTTTQITDKRGFGVICGFDLADIGIKAGDPVNYAFTLQSDLGNTETLSCSFQVEAMGLSQAQASCQPGTYIDFQTKCTADSPIMDISGITLTPGSQTEQVSTTSLTLPAGTLCVWFMVTVRVTWPTTGVKPRTRLRIGAFKINGNLVSGAISKTTNKTTYNYLPNSDFRLYVQHEEAKWRAEYPYSQQNGIIFGSTPGGGASTVPRADYNNPYNLHLGQTYYDFYQPLPQLGGFGSYLNDNTWYGYPVRPSNGKQNEIIMYDNNRNIMDNMNPPIAGNPPKYMQDDPNCHLLDNYPGWSNTWSEILPGGECNTWRLHYNTRAILYEGHYDTTPIREYYYYAGSYYGLGIAEPGLGKIPLLPGKYWRLSMRVKQQTPPATRYKDQLQVFAYVIFVDDNGTDMYGLLEPFNDLMYPGSGNADAYMVPLGMLNDTEEHTYVLNIGDWDHAITAEDGSTTDLKAWLELPDRVAWACPSRQPDQYFWKGFVDSYGTHTEENYLSVSSRAAYVYLFVGQPGYFGRGADSTIPMSCLVDAHHLMLECCTYNKPLTEDKFEEQVTAFVDDTSTPSAWVPYKDRSFNSFYIPPTTYRGVPVGPRGTLSFRVCLPKDDWFYSNVQCIFNATGNVLPRIYYDPTTKRLQVALCLMDQTGCTETHTAPLYRNFIAKTVDVKHWVPGEFHTIGLLWDELTPGYFKFVVDADYYDIVLHDLDVTGEIKIVPATMKKHFDPTLFKPIGKDPAATGYTTQLCSLIFGALPTGGMPFGGTLDEVRFDIALTKKETLIGWHHSGAPFGDLRHFVNRGGTVQINDGGIQILSDGFTLRGTDASPIYYNATADRGDFQLGLSATDHIKYDRSEQYLGLYGDIQTKMVESHLKRVPYDIEDGYARLYVDRDGNLLVETAEHGRRMFNCGVFLVSVNDGYIRPYLDVAASLLNIAALSIEVPSSIEVPMVGNIQWPSAVASTSSITPVTFRLNIGAPSDITGVTRIDAVHLSCERMHPANATVSVTLQEPTITVK